MNEEAAKGPSIFAPPPLLYLIPLVGGALLDRAVPLPDLPAGARRVGYPLAAAGAALGAWFVRTMHAASTPVDPRRASTTLVTSGPFRHSRNPGYIGLTLTYTGISLATNRRWPLLFLPAVVAAVDRGVIRSEERYLRDRFGQKYEDYEHRVPRWL